MKKLLIICIAICMVGCEANPKKPFIIIWKEHQNGGWRYGYSSVNGVDNNFFELSDKYNVGDTIR